MEKVREIMKRYQGQTEIVIVVDSFDTPEGPVTATSEVAADGNGGVATARKPKTGRRVRYVLSTANDCNVSCSAEFQREMIEVLGEGNVKLGSSQKGKGGGGGSVGR